MGSCRIRTARNMALVAVQGEDDDGMAASRPCGTARGRSLQVDRLAPLHQGLMDLFGIRRRLRNRFRRNPGMDVLVDHDLRHSAEVELCHRRPVKLDGDAAVASGDDTIIGIDGAVGCQNAQRAIGRYGLHRSVKDEYLSDDRVIGFRCFCDLCHGYASLFFISGCRFYAVPDYISIAHSLLYLGTMFFIFSAIPGGEPPPAALFRISKFELGACGSSPGTLHGGRPETIRR
jgi:hypothetical protein